MHPHEWPLRPRMVRYFLAAMGMFAWLCVIVVVAQGLRIGSRSPLLWGTAVGGVLAGLACWGACLRLSDSSIASVLNAIRTTLKQDQPARTETASPPLCRGLILSGLLFFALNATWVYHHQDSPEDDDQQAFLNTAREIHDRGGIPGLWSDLWSGRFEESNRHPLLLAIQSVNPTETGGRVISLAAASVTFALILILVRQKMGAFTAGLLSVLIGINGAWVYHAPRIVCESLLTGLAGLLWLSLIPERGTSDQESPPPLRLTSAAVAGLLTGLVYLTKGTGLLLFGGTALAFVIMAWIVPGQRRSWVRVMMTYSVVFLIVASPLLVRNAIRFGSPTYNVNSYLLWVDAYESPNAMADRMTLREARSAYLASHNITDMLKREVTGLVWEAFIGLRTLGIAPWSDARVLFGLPLFLLSLIGLSHAPRSASLVLVLWTITTWGVMAWYVPIAAGDRFVMPLLVPWLVLAADGLARIPDMTRDARTATRRIAFAVLLLGAISTGFVWVSGELWTC